MSQVLYEPPPPKDCREDSSFFEPSDGHRIISTLVWYRGRLVRFYFAWCVVKDGDWVERYSVCTRHGWLHEHRTGHRGKYDRRDLEPLYSQVDVQEAHDKAYNLVHNRYLKGIGKG